MSRALLLVGHGSHFDADSSEPLHAHAARIRAMGRLDQVAVASWKEEPSLARGLDGVDAADVAIVPLFMADGYFSRQVVPREMRLDGRVTSREGRTLRYTKAIGSHRSLAEVVVQRAREAGATGRETLVVLGHGTPASDTSAGNTRLQAEFVTALGAFPEVVALFIDQEPNVRDVWSLVRSQEVVVVPLFIADGWHVGQTIPAELPGGEGGRRLRYAAAVGTHPEVARVIVELAEEAFGWPAEGCGPVSAPPDGPRALPGRIGELEVRRRAGGRVVVRRAGDGGGWQGLTSVEELRRRARFDQSGRYRPLAGARDLPGGWRIDCASEGEAADAIEAVYPLALRHQESHRAGRLEVLPIEEVLERQTGRYEVARRLSARGRTAASEVLCGRCVKTPVWRGDSLPWGGIPCPEACSVLVGLWREGAILEASLPSPRATEGGVAFAAFEEPGNEVREAWLAEMARPEEGPGGGGVTQPPGVAT